jgi:peptide/nickel transport system ATP-binding protein
MNSEPILSVRNLAIGFNDKPVLEVSGLTLHRGQKALLTGPSGSGKSLLLAALGGLLPGTSVLRGQFQFAGQKPAGPDWLNYQDYRGACGQTHCFGLLLQDTMQSLHPYRSLRRQFPDNVSNKKYSALLDSVKLSSRHLADDREWRMPHQISGGERQRLALLLTGAERRSITFLDEPITDIDIISRKSVEESVNDLFRSSQNTVLIVTHDWDWLEGKFSHHRIENGKLVSGKNTDLGATVLRRRSDTILNKQQAGKPLAETTGNVLNAKILKPFSVGRSGFQLLPTELKFKVGRSVGILGESGCGKSSLIRMLVGLQRRNVYRDYVDLKLYGSAGMSLLPEMPPLERAGISQMVHQDTTGTLIENETIRGHLERIYRRRRGDKKKFDRLAMAFAQELGLVPHSSTEDADNFFSKSFSQLSMGMRRRASLLRTYMLFDILDDQSAQKPKILFLDEISRGLDPRNRDLMTRSLTLFARTYNVALVAISHDVNFLKMFCDEFRLMFNGAVLPGILSTKEVDIYCAGEGKDLKSNPYYHQFFHQVDIRDVSGKDRSQKAGCLFDQVKGCVNNSRGDCRHERRFRELGALGICE